MVFWWLWGGISLPKTQIITKKAELDLSLFEQLPSESVWADYLQHRQNKKAHLTQTALNRLATAVNEANTLGYSTDTVLAECMLQNWQGFNAAWLENKKTSNSRRDELEAAWNNTSWENGLEGYFMQCVSILTAKISRQPSFAQPTENPINPQFIKLFNRFFERLKVIFPASISVLNTSAKIEIFKQQWITAFAENNINSDHHINAGLRIARQQKSPFLPSVWQFIDWRQQGLAEAYGLPTPQQLSEKLQAYCRQRGHNDIHKFDYGSNANCWLVYELYRAMIAESLNARQVEEKARLLIDDLTRKLRNGYVIPQPQLSLPQKTCMNPMSQSVALERISAIKAKFGFGRSHSQQLKKLV